MHFIIGADGTMLRISIIFLIALIFSCARLKENSSKNQPHVTRTELITQFWNHESDSINLFIHILVPNHQFVFLKGADYFYSKLVFTLVISDKETDQQIKRLSWSEEIREPYYDDTRDPEKYFASEKSILLNPGEYKLFLNIQDIDSRRNWKNSKELKLNRVNTFSEILPFNKSDSGFDIFSNQGYESIDTLWFRCQVNNEENGDDSIKYSIFNKESVVDSGFIPLSGAVLNKFFFIPIPLPEKKSIIYEIKIYYLNKVKSFKLSPGNQSKIYWTDDLHEVAGVMSYILAHSEYRELKKLNEEDQWTYIKDYWLKKDPTPTTPENELLVEMNDRVKYVNKHFSILMHGWRTDRGRIYINYGQPHHIDDSYRDQTGYNYQIWVYPNSKQFVFVDRAMFGDYELLREIN